MVRDVSCSLQERRTVRNVLETDEVRSGSEGHGLGERDMRSAVTGHDDTDKQVCLSIIELAC